MDLFWLDFAVSFSAVVFGVILGFLLAAIFRANK
jgi:hypothetical protein